uniref:Putative plant transposon protein domain-containing protein n=1 Tax=Solanum tuberosum TaxID=4113 RepID=M1DN14_SOLTU
MARWEHSKDTGRHNTLHFANFNQVARVWLKIVCSVLLPAKHLTKVTRDRVVLIYMLMKGMPINVRAILRHNMMKFKNNLRWQFCYEGFITRFLRARGIEKKVVDLNIVFHPKLTGKLVDVTRTKALDTSHGPVLSAQERQAHDDSVMERMFGMAELQLRIRGRLVTDEEMENLADRYPLTKSTTALCKTGPAFLEPLDNDEATADEAMDDEEDDADDKEPNALMVFDGDDNEA